MFADKTTLRGHNKKKARIFHVQLKGDITRQNEWHFLTEKAASLISHWLASSFLERNRNFWVCAAWQTPALPILEVV